MAGPEGIRFHIALTGWIAICVVSREASEISREEYLEMRNYLEFINKPGLTTIKTEEGDIFDCVDVNEQPALDHPALKHHIVQYVVASLSGLAGGTYQGTQVSINVWNPQVKQGETFSLAQLWIINGQGQNLNTIEVGWNVYPGLYGDSATHLFVYCTADNYRSTGCYNLFCSGFVQFSRTITPGIRLPKISSFGGTQEDITLLAFWDEGTQNWWLGYHETQSSSFVWVGYWSGSLFKALVKYTNRIDWGGEVVGDTFGTYPQMGNGHFPAEGYKKTAYMNQILYVDKNFTLRDVPNNIVKTQTRPKCYKIQNEGKGSTRFGRYFFFGGPGGRCAQVVAWEDASE
ncbi:protein neprosin-like [Aristolochia californica]|uniref:protein neprosin-like n=1 Tax=Aristolochia californica TaxID=171875 RepID=UPI0035DFCAAD